MQFSSAGHSSELCSHHYCTSGRSSILFFFFKWVIISLPLWAPRWFLSLSQLADPTCPIAPVRVWMSLKRPVACFPTWCYWEMMEPLWMLSKGSPDHRGCRFREDCKTPTLSPLCNGRWVTLPWVPEPGLHSREPEETRLARSLSLFEILFLGVHICMWAHMAQHVWKSEHSIRSFFSPRGTQGSNAGRWAWGKHLCPLRHPSSPQQKIMETISGYPNSTL